MARAQAVRSVRTWGKVCYVGEGDTVTLDVIRGSERIKMPVRTQRMYFRK